MALVGTISGSNGTSNTAVTGTLVIANITSNFPAIQSDAVLFVSGNIGGTSKAVIGGDLVVSGTTKLFSDLTLSGSNVYLGGNTSIQNDLIYIDKANERVGIGTSSPEATLDVRSQGTGNVRSILGQHYDNTTAFSQFKFIGSRARGTVGSPSAVQANDSLVSFGGRGYKTTGWSNTVGGTYIYARENWTDSSTPTYITLRGVASGDGTTVTEWAKIDNAEFVAKGTLITSGTLKSVASAGDEGGEIFLNKAVTNTTVDTGVTIDVYQNRLRIFETGGALRGGYYDITALANGVGTNLAAGGSATPGGSDTYVQYNDAAAFGGNAAFRFNKTTGIVSAANIFVTGSGDSLVTSGNIVVKDGAGNSNVIISPSGDITGSNLRLTGDIAVVGGDLTTTVSSFNLINNTATTVNFAGSAAAVNIGAAASVTALAGDLNIGGGGSKVRFGTAQQLQMLWNVNAAMTNTSGQFLLQQQSLNSRLEAQLTGSTSAGMFRVRNLIGPPASQTARDLLEVRNDGTIMIGSASSGPTFLGSTTIMNDLFLASGIVAVSTDTTDIQLISSGNVTVKLDANNNATGHFFAIRDFNNVNQFRVTETGDADVTGNLVVTGSSIATATTTTFNLLNSTLTGTLNIGGATQTMNFGSPTTTGTMQGDFAVANRTTLGGVIEKMTNSVGSTGTVNFDLINQSVFYVNNPTGPITANFTNVPTTNLRVITPTVILSQSATGRIVSAVSVDGVSAPAIKWANGVTPTGNANKQDVFGFSLIRSGSVWTVLGQMSTYG